MTSRAKKSPRKVVRPHVLVVGGGFAGICAAETLVHSLPKLHVVLVATQDFFEFLPSSLRCMVQPRHIENITCDLRHRRFQFIHGTVTSTMRRSVLVKEHTHNEELIESSSAEGELLEVAFTYCIWSAGVAYPSPIKTFAMHFGLSQRRAELTATRAALIAAKRILIVGGGLAGVELAAELAAGLPNPKSRTIVIATSSRGLLPRLPRRAGAYANAWLKSHGVEIVLSRVKRDNDERRSSGDPMQCFSREDGLPSLRADIAFECTGGWRGSGCYALLAGGVAHDDDVDVYGKVSVRRTLQLQRLSHIFAVGDCAIIEDEFVKKGAFAEKTAYSAMEAGRLAARNVCALIVAKGRAARAKLESFPEDAFPLGKFPRVFAVSLYKWDGLLCIGPTVLTGKIAALAKWGTELVGFRAMAGSRTVERLFFVLERIMFFITVVVQLLFRYEGTEE